MAPVQTYRTIEAPIAFYIGKLDENIPPDLSIEAMSDVIAQRPDADVSLVVYQRASHGSYVVPGDVQGISQDVLHPNLSSYEFAPGYIDHLRAWIRARAGLLDVN